nr:MAG TPA: hypothetical protein [Caudoviricetes sp.]
MIISNLWEDQEYSLIPLKIKKHISIHQLQLYDP